MKTETMTAMDQLRESSARIAKVETTLNELGTTRNAISEQVRTACKLAGDFASDLTMRTAGQAVHDQITNLPAGILQRSSYKPERAFRAALAGACGTAVHWDITQALLLCGDILEDVNAHGEAKAVREMAYKPA